MKKIFTLVIAFVMLLAVSVQVEAGDYRSTKSITRSETARIADIMGDITVKKGATLTVTEGLLITGKLTIEEGAVVEFQNELVLMKGGTLNISGILRGTVEEMGICQGSINITKGGDFDVVFKNGTLAITFQKALRLTDKPSNKEVHVRVHEHVFNGNKCQCGTYLCEIGEAPHTWKGGVCTYCKTKCTHSWTDGICDTCGVYICKEGGQPHTWEQGVCKVCHDKCKHGDWKDGICTICNEPCKHENGYLCADCGEKIVTENAAGATITSGSLTIIVGAACLVVGFLISMFIFRKKSLSHQNDKE